MERLTTARTVVRDRRARSRGAARRILVVATAGYAVVGVFALVYGVVRSGWPDLTQVSSVTIAALAAAPLALALLWDRLGGFKAFGFEVTLTAAPARMDIEVIGALTERQYFSEDEAIVERITQAIARPEQELLELNLRDGNYWWSTRLFLLAALAEDYSRIQQLVFVERGGERGFVGMAVPGDIRRALAMVWPTLELSYQTIKKQPPPPKPSQPGASIPSRIVFGFADWNTFERGGKHVREEDLVVKVNATLLHDWLLAIGRPLTVDSVDWPGRSDPYLVRSLLFEFDAPYVALLRHRRLDRVVNRFDLAVRVARNTMR
jgi:hypothetical protein